MTNDSLTLLKNRLVDGALHFDASTLEGRYMSCPREFFYYGLRKREAVRDTIGRDFGKFMHTVLLDHYTKPHADVLTHMDKRWATAPATTDPDQYRNLEYAHAVYDYYLNEYPSEPFDIIRVETPIAVPFMDVVLPDETTVPCLWTGRVDLVIRMHATGQVWLIDHKTSSMAGETFWTQWVNSTQMHGYVWGVEQLIGEPVQGYIINALFVRKPTKTGKGIELKRQMYPVGDTPAEHKALLDGWKNNTEHTIASILDHVTRGYWPMHTNACVRKYGTCEYHEVCRHAGQRELLLTTDLYRDVTWTPLED